MKYDVRLTPTAPMFGPKLLLNGKGEVHVAETALIVEGNLALARLPLVAPFYYGMLSHWTMRTIPYTRIVKTRYTGHWLGPLSAFKVLAVLLLLLLLVPAVALAVNGDAFGNQTSGVVISLFAPVLIWFLLTVGRRSYHLTYMLADGKPCKVIFRIQGPPRETREQFTRLLEEYTRAAQSFQPQAI